MARIGGGGREAAIVLARLRVSVVPEELEEVTDDEGRRLLGHVSRPDDLQERRPSRVSFAPAGGPAAGPDDKRLELWFAKPAVQRPPPRGLVGDEDDVELPTLLE